MIYNFRPLCEVIACKRALRQYIQAMHSEMRRHNAVAHIQVLKNRLL